MLPHPSLRALIYSAVAVAVAQTFGDINDPKYGATLLHFDIDTADTAVSQFSCTDLGARCVFRRANYKSVKFGTGQESAEVQGTVWAATADSAVLTLGACTAEDEENNCIVTCNANCTCGVTTTTTTTNTSDANFDAANATLQPCTKLPSRAPTRAPKSEAPVVAVCPKIQFEEFCGDLMNTLPLGIEGNYDCFNFCGGVWTSNCDYSGICGQNECGNKTAAGTANGQVYGCTVADKATAGGSGSAGAGNTKSGTINWAVSSTWSMGMMLGYAVLGAVLQVAGLW